MTDTLGYRRDGRRSAAAALRRQPLVVRLGAVVAIAAAVGVVFWLTLGKSGSPKYQIKPVPISASGLATLASVVPSPIYWAGPMPGKTYELSRTSSGRVYIRYLPRGVEIGAKAPYLTIGTYPVANAFAATQKVAREKDSVGIDVGAGAIAFYNRSHPQSVLVAESGSDYQVEVYDPNAAQARTLVTARKIAPVRRHVQTPTGASPVSAAGLRTLAGSLKHPVFWLGRRPGFTYELTRTSDGRIFVRYLPPGVKVGATQPYLTVATYPYQNAFTAIQSAARTKGALKIELPGGGLAVVDGAYPKSIHLAYPRSNYQVEVFDPSPAKVREVVSSGQVQVVR